MIQKKLNSLSPRFGSNICMHNSSGICEPSPLEKRCFLDDIKVLSMVSSYIYGEELYSYVVIHCQIVIFTHY